MPSSGGSVATAVELSEDRHRGVRGASVNGSVDLMGVCDIKPVLFKDVGYDNATDLGPNHRDGGQGEEAAGGGGERGFSAALVRFLFYIDTSCTSC
jgi:hypothetical protein